MRCLIVSKTRARNTVCVGALSVDGSNLRLTKDEGFPFLPTDTPYEIGQVWDVQYTACRDLQPPHVEDVLVTSAKFLYSRSDLAELILKLAQPWVGGVSALFEGMVRGPTSSGSAYIQDPVPSQSVGFWMPDRNVIGRFENTRFYYKYGQYRIPYLGVAEPRATIPVRGLTRVSLARWFKPDDSDTDFPARCYLQISGSY